MKKIAVAGLGILAGMAAGGIPALLTGSKKIGKYKELDRKNNIILGLYGKWMDIRNEGKTVADYLKENGYRSVAIYGMHYIGENLLEELRDHQIEVKYAIDRNADNITSDVDVFHPEDDLPDADAVIVTAFYYFDEIQDRLQGRVSCPVLSFEDIIYEML